MFTNTYLLRKFCRTPESNNSIRRQAIDLFVAGTIILSGTVGAASEAQASPARQAEPTTTVNHRIFLPVTSNGFDINSIPLPDNISIDVEAEQEQSDDLQALASSSCAYASKSVTVRPHQSTLVGEYRASGNCSFVRARLNRTGIVLVAYNRYGYWESKGWRRIYPGQSYVTKADLARNTPVRVWVYNPYSQAWNSPLNRYHVQSWK